MATKSTDDATKTPISERGDKREGKGERAGARQEIRSRGTEREGNRVRTASQQERKSESKREEVVQKQRMEAHLSIALLLLFVADVAEEGRGLVVLS